MAVYKLPNEYQQVEYLESTNSYPDNLGSCWFEIPINISSTNLKICGKVSNWTWMDSEIGEYILYTTYDGEPLWRFLKGSTNGSTIASVNGVNNDYYFTSDEFSTQPFIFVQTNTYINILGNQQVSLSGGVSVTMSNVRFFNNAKFRLYFAEIYDGGTLAFQLIPCYRKIDGETGLYDVVNGIFYTNQGTGNFILGPEIKYQYSTFNTLLRRRIMSQHYKKILRGLNVKKCYFPTGINGAGDVCVEIKITLYKSPIGQWGFGSRISAHNKGFGIVYTQTNMLRFDYNNQHFNYNDTYLLGVTYTLKIDKGVFYVNGNIIGRVNQSSFDNGLEIYLCDLNNNGSASLLCNMDFYYAKIWKNDVLVRDYVPSMVNSVYGLYDNISESFGTFISKGNGSVSPI